MGWSTSWTEVLGFVTGAVCVVLVARQHIANWPVGIANNVFFIVLFVQSGLYADAGLQVVFIALAAYGWWSWTHGVDQEPPEPCRCAARRPPNGPGCSRRGRWGSPG